MPIKTVVRNSTRIVSDSFDAAAAGNYADNDVISDAVTGADLDALVLLQDLTNNTSFALGGKNYPRVPKVIRVTIVDTTPSIIAGTIRITGVGTDEDDLVEDINIAAGAGTYNTVASFLSVSAVESIGVSVLDGAGDETIQVGLAVGASPMVFRNAVPRSGIAEIVGANLSCEEDAVIATSELLLFSAVPTASEMDDNDAFAGVGAADLPNYLGSISFGALVDVGTGGYIAATAPTPAAPLIARSSDRNLYGILVLRDAETNETAGMEMIVTLYVR